MKYFVGDVVKMRKTHPCGGTDWEVLRVGMDFRIKCIKCNRVVMLPRPKFERAVKTVISSAQPQALTDETGKIKTNPNNNLNSAGNFKNLSK